ncbi:DUF4249 domain-containing protein [Flavobacterium sp. LS1R49]|uniref:DUF4249 domain-containing protein n=1 Tax=Flavobacterium shii TaxID=2987687 RepID=A0A9X2Z9D0_9FLAO|nr:DUF4249 domain-containing protein [Flavobacterium shii]MCV9926686.1 DUF4249 domain-containing protein [Flavobacterium shii]
MNSKINKILVLLLLTYVTNSCTETYALQTDTYEEAIVIEATLTNEFKKQEIKVTKTARFEDEGVTVEKGANVIVKDDQGNEYSFIEQSGIYVSQTEFTVTPGRAYYLEIVTKDGKIYKSSNETLTTETPITSIVPSVASNKQGTGIQINVNSYDPNNTSKYYRYEYEETYKIIAPRWTSFDAAVTGPQSVELVPRSPDTKVCYATKKSTDIILTTTGNQTEDRVNFPIRFIEENNYIISHRYSILVKQYVENLEAYTFHKTMKEISSSSSVLSPKQPGVISGNIKCISNIDEKVIGFFDVATVSSQRIFFNYTDFFPSNPQPSYVTTCEDIPFKFCFGGEDCEGETMIYKLVNKNVVYISNGGIKYIMVNSECGDCTTFSSNIIPSFWKN